MSVARWDDVADLNWSEAFAMSTPANPIGVLVDAHLLLRAPQGALTSAQIVERIAATP